jgi:antitoxin Phd
MREIGLREAKATLSAVIDSVEDGETTVITRHGKPVAVVIGLAEWRRLAKAPSFGELLARSPLTDEDLPPREPWVAKDLGF